MELKRPLRFANDKGHDNSQFHQYINWKGKEPIQSVMIEKDLTEMGPIAEELIVGGLSAEKYVGGGTSVLHVKLYLVRLR